jgi:hypothetical protein
MQFLKKHYEKILLGTVLAGLMGVLVFMLFYIASDEQAMEDAANGLINPPARALPDLDLTTNEAALTRLSTPFSLDLETGNKVFNPFEWQRTLDNRLVKKINLGARLAVVTRITPLYTVLSLDSVETNELGARYVIGVEKQAARWYAERQHHQYYVSMGDKPSDTYGLALIGIKGPPDNPDAVLLKIMDTGEIATVTPSKPFRRVDGYVADFRYDPEKKVFHGCRIGTRVSFSGRDYVVVEVNKHELILADVTNGKKTSLPFEP